MMVRSDDPFAGELLLGGLGSDLGLRTRTALVLVALGLHGALFLVTFPAAVAPPPPQEPVRHALTLHPWMPPPPPPKQPVVIDRQGTPVPIPDATPNEPEPVVPAAEEPLRSEPRAEWDAVELPREVPARPAAPAAPLVPDGVNVTLPELLPATKVLPEYPQRARRAGAEGRVILQVVVDRNGVVDEIEVVSAPGPDLGFSAAAREAVRQWRYQPARQQGVPVAVYLTVMVDFSID